MENTNGVVWGVPVQRVKKTEKYDFPVVTMEAIEKEGSNRKFSFNKAALEALELVGGESTLAIGFTANNDVLIKKDGMFKLAKNNSFSDKRTFEYIAKILKLDISVENEFALVMEPTVAGTFKFKGSFQPTTEGFDVYSEDVVTNKAEVIEESEESVDETLVEEEVAQVPEHTTQANPFLSNEEREYVEEAVSAGREEEATTTVEEEDEWA
jgi:hypothetical protein